QLGLALHMPLHRLGDVLLGRAGRESEFSIERVELEEVAMGRAARRTRATVADLPEAVGPVAATILQRLLGRDAFGKPAGRCREVVEHPVDPRAGGRIRI